MSQQPGRATGRATGRRTGGRSAAPAHRESGPSRLAGEPAESAGSIAWQPVGREEQVWRPGPAQTLTRRRQRQAGRTYASAIPPTIADRTMVIPSGLLADLDDATMAVAGFNAESRLHSSAVLAVLMRSESSSSSQIEQITASARAIAEAEFTGLGSGNAAIVAANAHAMAEAMRSTDRLTADAVARIQGVLMKHDPRMMGWRQEPVWIGGGDSTPITASFVPPDHSRIVPLVDDLVQFANRDDLPILAQTAIAHAQFETIHPFADGNGRTGRALVHLMLRSKGLTTTGTVPISGGLLTMKDRYFSALDQYRKGDAGPIVSVFVDAAIYASGQGRQLGARVEEIRASWRERIKARSDSAIWKVLDLFAGQPIGDAESVAASIGRDPRNVHRQLRQLVAAGILVGGQHYKSRRYLFRAPQVLDALDEYSRGFGRRQRLR